ncbi:hypothetical protein [Streptomyces jumonjinensis]|uniref:hypothetical protein n=1 Tax=Streptomyces jumonjinensis TaxID=1945 RepID=UPI00129662A5|nr:hypothetical protein [Streptomyces jumonjinensis]
MAGLLVLLLVLLAVRVRRRFGGRAREFPVGEGTAAGVRVGESATASLGVGGEFSEGSEAFRGGHPRRRVGRPTLRVLLRHRGLKVGVDGGGPLGGG